MTEIMDSEEVPLGTIPEVDVCSDNGGGIKDASYALPLLMFYRKHVAGSCQYPRMVTLGHRLNLSSMETVVQFMQSGGLDFILSWMEDEEHDQEDESCCFAFETMLKVLYERVPLYACVGHPDDDLSIKLAKVMKTIMAGFADEEVVRKEASMVFNKWFAPVLQ